MTSVPTHASKKFQFPFPIIYEISSIYNRSLIDTKTNYKKLCIILERKFTLKGWNRQLDIRIIKNDANL